jgi:hypothetical protein
LCLFCVGWFCFLNMIGVLCSSSSSFILCVSFVRGSCVFVSLLCVNVLFRYCYLFLLFCWWSCSLLFVVVSCCVGFLFLCVSC